MLSLGHRFLEGYACVPDGHNKASDTLQLLWKNSLYIQNMYFATSTFSSEGRSYFPDNSNHYLLASFSDTESVRKDLAETASENMSFIFPTKQSLFERPSIAKLNYVSIYFIKQSYNNENVKDLEDVFLRRRDRLRTASLAEIQLVPDLPLKFPFPYSKDLIMIELESEKSHQSDQRYCENTRREVIKKGIDINNLVSFSILSDLK
jgi:hypothetical protein